jgi:flagellar hook-associated protein 1 FlgK
MSGILDIGTRALKASQLALQTAGNNIANVNTPNYSRQSLVIKNVAGQFSGTGYYGKGVEVITVQRNHSEFLTRQAAQSNSISAADSKRLEQLTQLEDIFKGGSTGIGASISNMLNSFSDVASAPTDLAARSVALSLADEMASRFRSASNRLYDLHNGVNVQLNDEVAAVNSLTGRIANANESVARALGSGQTPNDLLDHRDQLIAELNQHIQTTSVSADDGSVTIFAASSQPLVMGIVARTLSLSADEFSDPSKIKLSIHNGTDTLPLEESTLGGGEIAGLLRFQNTDLVDVANLLGRMALSISTTMNDQHKLGKDLSGAAGTDLFASSPIPAAAKATTNTGTAALTVSIQTSPSGIPKLMASNYEINFTSGTAGTLTRVRDGQVSSFSSPSPITIDGLSIAISTGTPAAGDRFLITPYTAVADDLKIIQSSPAKLAMAMDVSGQTTYLDTNSGNAQAMLALRDLALFDGAATSDGFASAMAEIGVRVQSATFTAAVSKSIAANVETDRASVSGVNLDEEAAKLLQFQQSYQACAKVLQISQSIFDSLLQTISR